MPNKPLIRTLVIITVLVVIAGIWWFSRKATWINMIKKKYPDGDAKNWTVDGAKKAWTLGQLIGLYYNGHPSLETESPHNIETTA